MLHVESLEDTKTAVHCGLAFNLKAFTEQFHRRDSSREAVHQHCLLGQKVDCTSL